MGSNDTTVTQVGTTTVLPQDGTTTPVATTKKPEYNIGAAMLAAQDRGVGAGITAGATFNAGRNFDLNLNANGGIYTNGATAGLGIDFTTKHNNGSRYLPIAAKFGADARYLNNSVDHIFPAADVDGNYYNGSFTSRMHNIQVGGIIGAEYQTRNGRITLGAGLRSGYNFALNKEDTHSMTLKTGMEQVNGVTTSTTETTYTYGQRQESDMFGNVYGYLNARPFKNKNISLNLTGEWGSGNKEITGGIAYNF